MRYRKPEELKATDVKWINHIPEGWEEVKLKFLFSISKGNGFSNYYDSSSTIEGDLIPYLSMEYLRKDNVDNQFINPEESHVLVRKNDTLILWDGSNAGEFIKGKFGALSTTLSKVPVKRKIEKSFSYYILKAIEKRIKDNTVGMGIPHVNPDYLKSTRLTLPPKSEQRSIAAFLDRKTEAIDALIEKKKQLIERFKEKRQALTTQAVTKGLDEDVPMKDSGIEWLEEIPEDWEITKVKWLVTKIGSGKTPRGGSQVYKDEGVPFLRSQNIHFDGLRLDDVVYINEEIHEDMISTAIKPNDVLLNITGASIGRASLVPEGFPKANLNQHVCILRPRKESLSPDFLHLVVSSNLIQNQIFAYENGTSREGLNFSQVGSLLLSLPPLDQQKIL